MLYLTLITLITTIFTQTSRPTVAERSKALVFLDRGCGGRGFESRRRTVLSLFGFFDLSLDFKNVRMRRDNQKYEVGSAGPEPTLASSLHRRVQYITYIALLYKVS